ncbi:Protein IN2-1 [Datura stramonium]|uniref:Protein IN2-1 n=1 Tax=Datura stramonium TaxID=4076 RepID=A0ABS8RTS8_DATST|nr:Protein IN2-1 [Datura stramonium]
MAASSIGYLIHIPISITPIVLPSRTKSTSLSFTFSNAKHPFKWSHRICALPTKLFSVMASGSSREVLPSAMIPLQSHQQSLMELQSFISLTHAHMPNVRGLLEIMRLQEKIMLVPIDLKEQARLVQGRRFIQQIRYHHWNTKMKLRESMDLIRYIDSNFEGPSAFPDEDRVNDAISAFDSIETALSKFVDGSFFLGTFSLVDIAYAPFIEKIPAFLLGEKL